ncbi:uncharacterized protein LOC129612155 [Condylostylus longicornis]|uniref:uncharacterized protein LOC129612155 n=1 Tax=Condylostylus longicornis TaxID=2530218 RepID=UPI00244E3D21|nr:uncharacterized protein LOC129612155 [Condylostylus longicornis]
MFQLLRQWGAKADDADDSGRHPLHYAAARGRIDFIQEVVAIVPNSLSALDRHLRSPLHVASLRGFPDVVKLFAKEDPTGLTRRDIWDLDSYTLAVTAGHSVTARVIKELLQERGVEVAEVQNRSLSLTVPTIQLELSPLELTVLDVLVTGLHEVEREQLSRCIRRLGSEMCLSLYRTTMEIQAKGGIPTKDRSRGKTAGGVFLGLIQEKVRNGEIHKDHWTYIRAVSLYRAKY